MAKQSIRLSDHFTYGKLLRFTLPSICMMVFTSIYGVVDGLFVSNFVGKTPFAAVNLVMPFVMILGGMGFMIGTGGTALVSKLLGEGKQEEAHRTFSMLVLFTLLFGAVLSAVGIITMPAVSRLLGASDAMMADCILYGRIVTGFTFAFMLQNVFQSFFIAAEKPRLGLFVTVAAGITNMVLDALFIAVFNWGCGRRGHCHRPEPVCRRRTAPDLLPAAQHQPAAPAARRTASAPHPPVLRQRLLRADEQHLLLPGRYALQFPAHAPDRRGRRLRLRRSDVRPVHLRSHLHRLLHRQRAGGQLPLRRAAPQ